MNRAFIVGIMGGSKAKPADLTDAKELGRCIAREGWVLLNGGRHAGIMDASAKGASGAGGLTVGILPEDNDAGASPYVKIPIVTGMGSARNMINVLTSHIVVACPGGAGTVSEIALALKHGKTVILLNFNVGRVFAAYRKAGRLLEADSPQAAVRLIKERLPQAAP